MADGAYKEIKASLIRIEDKLEEHGEKLSAIDEHLKNINGSIVRHEEEIERLCEDNGKIREERQVYIADWQNWRGSIDTKIMLVSSGSLIGILGLVILKGIGLF